MHDRNDADTRGTAGLLAVAQAQVGGGSASGSVDAGDYVFTYDANGNVAQVLDLSAGSAAAAITAHYEYDPYGGIVNDLSGYSYAEANPIRFSTKYWDAETGLGYWGYRHYSARLGRWINRDPLEEDGGLNLYAYVNDPLSGFDPLGLQATTQPRARLAVRRGSRFRADLMPPHGQLELRTSDGISPPSDPPHGVEA